MPERAEDAPRVGRLRAAGAWCWRRAPELCALYPVVLLGLACQCAWLAELHLGRWPIPSRDDPKSIAWNVSLLHAVVMVMIGAWPLPVAVGLARSAALRRQDGLPRTLARLLLLVAGSGLLVLVARHDPGRVFEWLFD